MINKKNNKKNPKVNPYWLYGGVIFLFILFQTFSGGLASSEVNKISQKKFFEYVSMGDIEKIDIVNKREVKVYLTDEASSQDVHKGTVNPYFSLSGRSANYKFELGDLQNFENSLKKKEDENNLTIDINYVTEQNIWGDLLLSMLPFVIIIGIWIFIMRKMSSGGSGGGGQIFSIGKSKAKLFDEKTDVKTSFKDVAGLEGAKEEVQEIVDFLKNPTKYTSLGGKIPKGALLVGAPGTGKTLLAKAVAGEAKAPFFSLSGSDFVEMFVGVGASRVRDMFEQGKKNSPCIIFIDEIDAMGRHRGAGLGGGNDEREQTLNQLLVEMDGFETNEGVILVAATNRPDVLDPALLRPGRFDRQVVVPNPDLKPEKSFGAELGSLISVNSKINFDFAVYYTHLYNSMIRSPFSMTVDSDDPSGSSIINQINYHGELSDIYAIQNTSKSWLYGFETGLKINLSDNFDFKTQYNYLNGEQRDMDGAANLPVRHVSPHFGNIHLIYSKNFACFFR